MESVREVLHSPLHESVCTQFFAAFLKSSAIPKSPTHALCALPDTINCSSKQERKITDIIKCYGTTKSIKEVELKNMKPEDNVTVSRYIERNVGSIINKDYVIEGFLGMGKLSDCKDEMVSRLDISKRYCLEILVAFLQEADIIILHEMFENVWNHTIEEILVEFSLRGAVVVFSEHGEESLMKLPMHSYDLSGRCVGW